MSSAKSSASKLKQMREYRNTTKGAFHRAKGAAKRRSISWGLTIEEFSKARGAYVCHYCGDKIIQNTLSGLDRIDSSHGYFISNVVACCPPCNQIKGPYLSSEEMKYLMEQLKLFRAGEVKEK